MQSNNSGGMHSNNSGGMQSNNSGGMHSNNSGGMHSNNSGGMHSNNSGGSRTSSMAVKMATATAAAGQIMHDIWRILTRCHHPNLRRIAPSRHTNDGKESEGTRGG
jgi:hypothetical protein